ncbi:hypothetical protein E3N88_01263 [Mikania micrantha]|uniref:Uncharacterized protein n=1 Tax=Mikania micrantha TaxID=192012 RepID=A0A5N6Q1Y8_9ASTR|nr:hypothetical protein E3N88_01263 [Mikania micrantha]
MMEGTSNPGGSTVPNHSPSLSLIINHMIEPMQEGARENFPRLKEWITEYVREECLVCRVISQHNQTARPQNRPSRTTKWHDGRTSGIKVNLPDTNKGKGEETFNENQVFGPKGKRQAPRQKVM